MVQVGSAADDAELPRFHCWGQVPPRPADTLGCTVPHSGMAPPELHPAVGPVRRPQTMPGEWKQMCEVHQLVNLAMQKGPVKIMGCSVVHHRT